MSRDSPDNCYDVYSAGVEDHFEDVDALLCWKRAEIAVSYRYDAGILLESAYWVLPMIVRRASGEAELDFYSSSFNARWSIRWNRDRLTVSAGWERVTLVVGERRELRSVVTTKSGFLRFWSHLLYVVNPAVEEAFVQSEPDPGDMKGLLRLLEAV